MGRKWVDGVIRDFTEEELEIIQNAPPPEPSAEERLVMLEEELRAAKILLGVDE